MSGMSDDAIVLTSEAARLVGRKVGTVRAWVCTGKVPVVSRNSSVCLVRLGDVRRVAAEMEVAPRRFRPCESDGCPADATAEEVEAIVAEQMANLPPWWKDDCRVMLGATIKQLAEGDT